MWKRHSIAAKKAAWDQAKSQNYAKIGKIIQMAAKWWVDPSMNPSLELALQKAKYYNLPRDVVDKAIKKWSWQLKWDDLKEILYEWYGPGGAAILVKTLTDNSNRTSANIRTIFFKYWWNLWEPGSVAWQFLNKWIFVVDSKFELIQEKWNQIEKLTSLSQVNYEEELLEFDIEDFDLEEDKLLIVADKSNFTKLQEQLKSKNYHVIDSAIHYVAENTISLSKEEQAQLDILIENLENDEDVDQVYSNVK